MSEEQDDSKFQDPSRESLDAESEALLDNLTSKYATAEDGGGEPAAAPVQNGSEAPPVVADDDAPPSDVMDILAPKKADPKPEDVKPVEKVEPATTFKEPKANHAFAQLRHEKAELEKKIAAQAAEMEKLQGSQAQSAEMDARIAELEVKHKAELEQMEGRLGQYDLASTKAFKLKFDAPLNSILARASNMLQKAGVEKDEADQLARELMQKPTLDRAQQLGELVPALSGSLVNLYEDFDEIRSNRDSALRDWKNSKAALGVDEQHLQQAKALELAEGLTSQVLKQQEDTGNPFFRKSASNPEWNVKVDERAAQFKGILKTGDQITLANLVAEGLTSREYRKMWEGERAKLAKLQAEVNSRFGVTVPPAGRGSEEPVVRQTAVHRDDDDIIEGIMNRHLTGVRKYPGE